MESKLAPGLLIAAPTMNDPRFARTVVLLAEFGEEGALGFVLNKHTPYTFGDLEDDIAFDLDPAVRPNVVNYGGPVQNERGWVLFRETGEASPVREDVLHVTSEIHLAATLEVLGEFVTARNEAPFKLLLGYAGWAPEQLESEIGEGAWIPMELDSDLLFTVPSDEMWLRALASMGLTPGMFTMGPSGSA